MVVALALGHLPRDRVSGALEGVHPDDRGKQRRAYDAAASLEFGQERVARILGPTTLYGLFALAVFFILTIGAWVMVVSARVGSQRTAQQIAGFVLGGMVVALSAIGSLLQSIPVEVVLGVVIAILLSDLVALELARRLWDREEAVARL